MASPAPPATSAGPMTNGPAAAGTTPTPSGASGAPRKIRRTVANPLVSRKKPTRPPGARPRPATASPAPVATPEEPKVKEEEEDQSQWMTYKLITTKASLLKGLRHHVMRLQSNNVVNPVDENEFSRPIRLHRRDPSAPLQGGRDVKMGNASREASAGVDAEKEEELAKRDAERAEQLAKIAPYGGAQKQKNTAFKKKTTQMHKGANEKEKKLRYEEYFPWFIEDFDNKNTWQGQLEQSLSNIYAMFVLDDGAFKMIPIEKWYKFTQKNKYKALDIDEAEEQLKKSSVTPRWIMKITHQKEKEEKMREEMKNAMAAPNKIFTRKGDRLEKFLPKSETADADDLDFEEDRFADDEEAPITEGPDEENREIEKRIKKEHLSANYFDARDEREYEEEEREQRKLKQLARDNGKKIKKSLMKNENNFTYEDSDSDNPYKSTESSDSEDEDEEAKKAQEAEEEAKKAAAESAAAAKQADKPKAPVPTEKNGTKPSPQKSKPKTSFGPNGDAKNLKRSGSPELSESGTEKARKKPKKTQASPPLTSAPAGGKKRKNGEAGSGEDTGGETSDGAAKQRLKLVNNGRPAPATATSSRAGSPVAVGTTRPQSPGTPRPLPANVPGRIQDQEILDLLTPEGISIGVFATKFGDRLKLPGVKPHFLASLKRLTNSHDKRIFKK